MAIKIAGTEVINDNRELVLAKLTEIDATISDTAVDIFVYDTRKDSDGGAWRKRTQHTSWYNETLNTATRGSRKEFPAVAVIVAESTQVTIYDGDDPNLPMWMVFNLGLNKAIGFGIGGTNTTTSCHMLNGLMFVGVEDATNSNPYSGYINFITEKNIQYGSATYDILRDIANRNSSTLTYVQMSSSYNIVNKVVNDVAMTVLPNAPIDAATGLPVPTVAVATNSSSSYMGSIIKDDGTVVSVSAYSGNNSHYGRHISIIDQEFYWGRTFYSSDIYGALIVTNVDGTKLRAYGSDFGSTSPADYIAFLGANAAGGSSNELGDFKNEAVSNDYGVTFLDENETTPANGMVAYTTSDYNTGWMNGDIKLATLSDTDDTDVTGSELITNAGPNFTNTDGWGASNGTLSVSSGDLLLTGSNTVNEHMYSTGFSLVAGQTYTLFIDSNQLFSYTRIGSTTSLATGEQLDTSTQVGLNSFTFTATTTGTFYLKLGMVTSYVTGSINSVSLRLAEEDRSVNGNGLQVFGTVTKSAVATGADLVAYSGFSSSNYLKQPHNTDLNFGTGDFCYMLWFNTSSYSTREMILRRDSQTSETGRFALTVETSGTLTWGYEGSSGSNLLDTTSWSTGIWNHIVILRRGSTIEMWVNGVLKDTETNTNTLTHADAPLLVGRDENGGNPAENTSVCLLRASATAPSPEQIKKIYEDEKVLFQEGAQATLYGSSDAVTALAYDDSTELLHVGTSAGRSVFQGLRRVDNTTTAVGAAISASNGLVADE